MIDLHLDLHVGAQKKDGPSAGAAMVLSLIFIPQIWVSEGRIDGSARLYRS